MNIINAKLENVLYKLNSTPIKRNIDIDGKRTTKRDYIYNLDSLINADNSKFLNWMNWIDWIIFFYVKFLKFY